MRNLKVFGVRSWVCSQQARLIVAAPTKAAAARLMSVSLHELATYGAETRNEEEVTQALSEPGVAWWMPTKNRYSDDRKWVRFEPTEAA